MKILRRLHTFFARAVRLSSLGHGAVNKARILIAYIWLSLKRSMGMRYSLRGEVCIPMFLFGRRIPVYYKNLIDFYLLEGLFIREEYSIEGLNLPRIIFDLGANTGLSTLYFKLRYPDAIIYAFEPDPTNASIFFKNTEWFKEDVHFHSVAVVGTPSCTIAFYIAPEHWSSSLQSRIEESREIYTGAITLDKALENYNLTKIDILKFDIEGAEWEVFKHFQNIRRVDCMVGEVHGDLIDVPKADFFKLFSDFEITQKESHYLSDRLPVVMKKKVQ